MQAIVTHQLRDLGFHSVDTAGVAVTALTMLAQWRYHLILSDCLGVDGYLVKPFDRAGLHAKLSAVLGDF